MSQGRIGRYALCLIVGLLGFGATSALVLTTYVFTQGGGFLVPMTSPSLGFFLTVGAPVLLAAFLPYLGVHLVATLLRLRVTPFAATVAGAALGALAAWALCGPQQCFSPTGMLPLLGWYVAAMVALAALLHALHAKARGFG